MGNFEGKWCISSNGESFEGEGLDTKEEAIKEGKFCGYKELYVGRCVENFEPCIDVDDVIERIQENAYDVGGEYAESYLENIKDEELKELNENLNYIFNKWASKYNREVNFYSVVNIEKIN